jgi:hypothetical protein
MKVTISESLLPVPYVWPSVSPDDRVASWQLSRHRGPHNGIVYVGNEQNRTRSVYDTSGKPRQPLTCLGQVIDLWV